MKLLTHRAAKIGAAAVVVLALAGGALAALTNGGSGGGTETAGTPSALTITGGTTTVPLYPGGSGDVAVSISNPNSIPLRVPSLQLDVSQGTGGYGVDGAHASCDLSSLTYTTQTNGGLGWEIPTTGLVLDLLGSISMATTAPNSCQGATFTVYLKVAA